MIKPYGLFNFDRILVKTTLESSTGRVASLVKGIAILEYIIATGKEMRLRDVAAHFSMDRSTAYRFLTTLENLGLLRKNRKTKRYSVGPRFFVWQGNLPQHGRFFSFIKPEIERLARETGQTSHFAALIGLEIELIEVVPSGRTIAVQQSVGNREPLYCSAVGKAILAFLPERERQAMMAQFTFERFTNTTLTSIPELEKELENIRDSKIAFDNGEGSQQVTCVAAPLLNADGYPVGAIGLSGVKSLYTGTIYEQTEWIESVVGAVKRIVSGIENISS